MSWTKASKTTIDMCNKQLEKMLRKLDMKQNKVLLKEEQTKLITVAEGEEVKCDFRIEKETNKRHTQTNGKEYNMNREKNNLENNKDVSNKDSGKISEEKQELIYSNILENIQNAKQKLNDSNIVEDSQNAKKKETSKQNPNDITKTTEKIRDQEKSCKKDKMKEWSKKQ